MTNADKRNIEILRSQKELLIDKFIFECEQINWEIKQIKNKTIKTNADRIRNMSDEELAEFILDITNDVLSGSVWQDTNGCMIYLESEVEE